MNIRDAEWDDLDRLLEMMRALYERDGVPFDAARARDATNTLISSMDSAILDYGRIWLIEVEGAVAGYVVLAFGFSLEYGGHHGFIDELFVLESYRGHGLGTAAVEHCVALCRHMKMSTILLEVDLENPRAHELYQRLRFHENRRRLMARAIDS